jgi:hypothetical protein
MPIERNSGETRDEFMSRCISKEIDSGKPQDQAVAICINYADEYFKSATPSVTDNTWSTEAPISINLEPGVKHYTKDGKLWTGPTHKDADGRLMTGATHTSDSEYLYHEDELKQLNLASYDDYPEAAKEAAQTALRWAEENGWGDCGTPVGKARANQLAKGESITKETIARMAAFERHRQNSDKELGDGCGRLMWLAWGGDAGIEWAQRKLEQIKKEEMSNQKFMKVKKVLFNEDFDADEVLAYKKLGFKVYIRSSRKIKRKDNKVWNQLKRANLTEDNLLFGEIEQLDKKMNFDLLLTGEDPVLEMLSVRGRTVNPKKVLKSIPVGSIEEAEMIEQRERNSIDLKFATVNFFYRYQEIPGIPAAKSGSRPFCKRLMSGNKRYTLEEIKSLSNQHLVEMFANYPGLQPDVFLYRGGFYRLPGTLNTTPYCRHQWTLEISMN